MFLEYCSEGDLKMFIDAFAVKQQANSFPAVLTESDARYVIKEVIEGLNYMSQNLIMHRDIKRDNILVH